MPASRTLVLVWLALLALLALTVVAIRLPLGAGRQLLSLGIGAIKAALILWFFMELRSSGALLRVVAFGSLLLLFALGVLLGADYMTRPAAG